MRFTVFLNPEGTSRLPKDVSQLTKVQLEANPDDSIWALAKQGEADSGIEVRQGRLLFPTPPDDSGVRVLAAVPHAIVKEDGALTWLEYPQRFVAVTVADMERTKEDGLYEGDPHATILDLPDVGNGGVVQTWPDFLQWLIGIGSLKGGVATLLGPALYVINRVRRRRKAADDVSSEGAWLAEFVERHRERWEERGAKSGSQFLFVLLAPRQWDSARLRRLLQIAPDEAAKFLEVCGYEYNPQTKLHELSQDAKERHLRGRLIDEFLGHDPATWEEDLGQTMLPRPTQDQVRAPNMGNGVQS